MEAPAKRALTETVHDAIIASNASYHDFISDDLTARLQNVGSRVRKSVAEGYATPAATPLTLSPVKQHHTTPVGFVPPSNQILQSVFGSPTRFGATASAAAPASPSPSPRKRVHDDERLRARDDDAMDCCEPADGDSDDSDDDEVLITPSVVGGGFPHVLANARPIRPLRRPRITQPVFSASVAVAAAAPASVIVVQATDVVMDYLPTIAHHSHHHRIPLPVTVGGGDDFGGQV